MCETVVIVIQHLEIVYIDAVWSNITVILWEIICVFPVYPHIITKITLSNPCLWLRTHNSAKERVWLHLFSMFQHMNLNEPGGENNYSLIQCWNPYQMLKARKSRSHTTAVHCSWLNTLCHFMTYSCQFIADSSWDIWFQEPGFKGHIIYCEIHV